VRTILVRTILVRNLLMSDTFTWLKDSSLKERFQKLASDNPLSEGDACLTCSIGFRECPTFLMGKIDWGIISSCKDRVDDSPVEVDPSVSME
jgi:hypothetical protein